MSGEISTADYSEYASYPTGQGSHGDGDFCALPDDASTVADDGALDQVSPPDPTQGTPQTAPPPSGASDTPADGYAANKTPTVPVASPSSETSALGRSALNFATSPTAWVSALKQSSNSKEPTSFAQKIVASAKQRLRLRQQLKQELLPYVRMELKLGQSLPETEAVMQKIRKVFGDGADVIYQEVLFQLRQQLKQELLPHVRMELKRGQSLPEAEAVMQKIRQMFGEEADVIYQEVLTEALQRRFQAALSGNDPAKMKQAAEDVRYFKKIKYIGEKDVARIKEEAEAKNSDGETWITYLETGESPEGSSESADSESSGGSSKSGSSKSGGGSGVSESDGDSTDPIDVDTPNDVPDNSINGPSPEPTHDTDPPPKTMMATASASDNATSGYGAGYDMGTASGVSTSGPFGSDVWTDGIASSGPYSGGLAYVRGGLGFEAPDVFLNGTRIFNADHVRGGFLNVEPIVSLANRTHLVGSRVYVSESGFQSHDPIVGALLMDGEGFGRDVRLVYHSGGLSGFGSAKLKRPGWLGTGLFSGAEAGFVDPSILAAIAAADPNAIQPAGSAAVISKQVFVNQHTNNKAGQNIHIEGRVARKGAHGHEFGHGRGHQGRDGRRQGGSDQGSQRDKERRERETLIAEFKKNDKGKGIPTHRTSVAA